MTLAETIYQRSLRLPNQAAREALDFIEFLEKRYGTVDAASDAPTTRDSARDQALARLAQIRIDWKGKPISDRDALYDDVRGGD